MSKHYKVIKSLTCASTGEEIEFMGCDAEITGETTSCYFVKFYRGQLFMIGKKSFMESTEQMREPTNITNMIVADISLWLNNVKIKTYRGVLNHDQQQLDSVKKNASIWFKLSYGTHYDRITYEVVNEISKFTTTETNKSETTMAKKATTGLKDVQTSTGVVLFEEASKNFISGLPAIPKSMTIGGVEFSEELIKKEVASAKKIVLKSEDDEETYLQLVELKKRFVKTRTAPDTFRDKEVRKPITEWLSALKAQTDAYGDLAQEGQDHCEAQITIYKNWKEAKEREEAERLQKLIDQRTVDLQSVAGVINRDSLHWTFPYLPSKLIENSFLEEADDSDWSGVMKELEDAYAADKAKQAAEREEFEKAKTAVYNARLQMLQLMGYDNFSKNGHTITEEQIRSTPDEEWLPLLQSHNTPAQVTSPFGQPQVAQHQSQGGSISTNPFKAAQQQAPPQDPFSAFTQGINAGAQASDEVTAEQDQSENAESPYVPHTIWDVPFVEKSLKNTVLRIFPAEHFEKASKIPDGTVIGYDGKWDIGLYFIIYQEVKK